MGWDRGIGGDGIAESVEMGSRGRDSGHFGAFLDFPVASLPSLARGTS